MPLSAGERLILAMMCDISKKMDAQNEIDPEFVLEAITSGHEWALTWEYSYLFEGNNDISEPPEVDETCRILNMWLTIEEYYWQYTDDERNRLKELADIFGENPRFRGFDANNDRHYGVTRFLVEKMGRYEAFENRKLSSNGPTLAQYREMLEIYEMWLDDNSHHGEMPPEDMARILKGKM